MSPSLLWSFARQELVDRYAGSVLGFAWAFLHPLVMLFIFVVIFGRIMGARLPGVDDTHAYGIYLVAGMLPWLAFAGTLARAATVYVDKQGVLSKIALSLPTLPVFIVLAESLTYLIGLAVFLVALLLLGHRPQPELLMLPWVFLIQQLLALGLGLILGVLNVFLRDVREFVAVLVQLWFWLTPIVWVAGAVPSRLYGLLEWINPMIPLTAAYHAMFLPGFTPDYGRLALVAVLATLLLAAGYLLVKALERDLRDFL